MAWLCGRTWRQCKVLVLWNIRCNILSEWYGKVVTFTFVAQSKHENTGSSKLDHKLPIIAAKLEELV